MGYADRVDSSPGRPTCWGNPKTYDPNDMECNECRFRHSCRAQIHKGGGSVSHRSSATRYRRSNDDDVRGTSESGLVGADERPIERFAKDAVAGALRGMFYEMYEFWRRFRFR
jgi:hypothetical protein